MMHDVDLFDGNTSYASIDTAMAVFAMFPEQTFTIKTSFPDAVEKYMERGYLPGSVCDVAIQKFGRSLHTYRWEGHDQVIVPMTWPLPNVKIVEVKE